jgi:MFS transporter, DHA2 family, multidrug resistance protein
MLIRGQPDDGPAPGEPDAARSLFGGGAFNRSALTASIILAVIMQGVDNSIANVALPHIQGSLSASQDQAAWVLTSYIVTPRL